MSKRREELRRKVARGQARARGEAVPGLSPNPAANLIMANAIVRTGSILLRRAVDKRMLRGRYGKDTAEAAAENQGLGSTLTALALSKVAARSSTGAECWPGRCTTGGRPRRRGPRAMRRFWKTPPTRKRARTLYGFSRREGLI